jgi:hypothetical protein
MSVLSRLEQWKNTGAISSAQCDVLSALVRNDRFSVFVELNTLLYLGVLSFVAGVGWMVATYSARLGDAAILSSLTFVFCWSLYYCFTRALPYSHHRVEHPGLAFDYVLYLGCLVFAIDLGYLDARVHPFQHDWDNSLLLASAVFFALAYRFDNRFVLSLALSSLAGWFGVRVSRFGLVPGGSLRVYALAYGGVVAGAGTSLYFAGIKKHFLEAYLHIATNVLFMALLSGIGSRDSDGLLYLLGLLGLAALAIVEGVRFRRFAFVVYGVLFGYAGISFRILREIGDDLLVHMSATLAYLVVSGTIVIVSLVVLARRFGRDE